VPVTNQANDSNTLLVYRLTNVVHGMLVWGGVAPLPLLNTVRCGCKGCIACIVYIPSCHPLCHFYIIMGCTVRYTNGPAFCRVLYMLGSI
jgi:hypothetical protein